MLRSPGMTRGTALMVALGLGACGGSGGGTTQGGEASGGSGGGPTTEVPTGDAPSSEATGTAGSGSTSSGSSGSGSSGQATDTTTDTTGAVTQTAGETGASSTGESSTGEMAGTVPVLPSAGCGLRGAPTGHLEALQTKVDGVDRSYDLFVPTPYDAERPHAVIFSYHGVGGTANTNQFKLDTFSAANDGFSINVAPQGWPSAEWSENHFVPFNLDASLVVFDQVLDLLAAQYCVDLNRVFVTGHSNGGQMAFHLGCLRADRVQAVFPSGGRCFSYGQGVCDPYHDVSMQCNGGVMVMSVMGEDDVTRHADEAATVAGFAGRQGCSMVSEAVEPSPCLRFTGCDAGDEVRSCRIPGLAHQLWKDGLDEVYGVMMGL